MTASWPLGTLRPLSYQLLVVDPPWHFRTYSEEGQEKSAQAHYDCMDMGDIARLPIGHLAQKDCLLLCWGTFPLIDQQLEVVRAWGFEYKSMMIWHKIFPSGKTAVGTGYRVRSMCEPVIVATIGNPVMLKALPGLFKGEHSEQSMPELFTGVRREHSRKPQEFYDVVDHCCPKLLPRADVFTRESRAGWEGFGNEATKFDRNVA